MAASHKHVPVIHVVSFRTDGPKLFVLYDDGHAGIWNLGARHGTGPYIHWFRLKHGQKTVANYRSPFSEWKKPNKPTGFVLLAPGYKLERACRYWEIARRHIETLANQEHQMSDELSPDLAAARAVLKSADTDYHHIAADKGQTD